MRLVTYQQMSSTPGRASSAGVLVDDVVFDINALLKEVSLQGGRTGEWLFAVEDVLRANLVDEVSDALAWFRERYATNESSGIAFEMNNLQLLPPVLRPSKVIGVGMNYRSFLNQLGEPEPLHPTLFHKTSSALRGHGQAIIIPSNTDQAVPEGELAIVIGRRATRVTTAEAGACIAGYACANDISARNMEFQTTQWTNGKMLPTFGPLGPAMVTPDEIDNADDLRLRTILNGEVIQEGSTSGMVFSVTELVSKISMLVQLEVGDVVLTGTPSDLGEVDPPIFLTAGDTIRVEIDGVGELSNPVIAEHLSVRGRDRAKRDL